MRQNRESSKTHPFGRCQLRRSGPRKRRATYAELETEVPAAALQQQRSPW
jgi:hypothetical protein